MYYVPFLAERHALGVPVTHMTISGYSDGQIVARSVGPVVDSFEPVR